MPLNSVEFAIFPAFMLRASRLFKLKTWQTVGGGKFRRKLERRRRIRSPRPWSALEGSLFGAVLATPKKIGFIPSIVVSGRTPTHPNRPATNELYAGSIEDLPRDPISSYALLSSFPAVASPVNS